jgi:hypothetical protein
MSEGLRPNSPTGFAEQFPVREPSSNPGLCVTVITTTPTGTAAALHAAKSLSKDLGARITLLSFEFVRIRSLLGEPSFIWDYTPEGDGLCVPGSPGQGEDVQARTCLCNNREGDLPLVLRRRALVVIGGKRRWLPTREQKLERALRRLGHHVIFINVGSETGRASKEPSLRLSGKAERLFFNKEAAFQEYVGSRMIQRRDHD